MSNIVTPLGLLQIVGSNLQCQEELICSAIMNNPIKVRYFSMWIKGKTIKGGVKHLQKEKKFLEALMD